MTRRVIGHRVRTGRWRRPTRGVVDVAVEPPEAFPVAQAKVRAAILALMAFGPDAIAVGLTALVLHGVWGVPPTRAPQVSLPRASGRAHRDNLVCRRFERGVRVQIVHGMRVVPPIIALAQAVCEVSPRTALGLLDSAVHRGVITGAEVREVRTATRRRRGCRKLAHVWDLVDGRRESPPESGAWLDLWQAGLQPTDVQIEIRDANNVLIARPDIGFEFMDGSWLFVEIDGDDAHVEGNTKDEARDGRLITTLANAGIRSEVRRYRSRQLGFESEMVSEVRAKIAGRRWRHPTGP